MKQAIKKKTVGKKPSIDDIKAKLGLTIENDTELVNSSAIKPLEFIPMPDAFVEALKLPGIPMGVLTLCAGHSNTGKSSLKNCLIASCINNGILPVIFETENNWNWKFALSCGVKATPVYQDVEVEEYDEETGELIGTHIEQEIVDYKGDFLYYDNKILCNKYGDNDYSTGKKTAKKRKQACIEDIVYCINEILDMQDNGEIDQPLCFIWDSVGSITSFKSLNSKVGNPMFDAASVSTAFNSIINDRIPSSRKVSEKHTNTMFFINKIWIDSMSNPMAAPSVEMKNGRALWYGSRLILILGGKLKASTKKLNATAKGQTYNYGLVTKISTMKNQLEAPYTTSYDGTFCCVPTGIVSEDKLDDYKKHNMKIFLKELEDRANAEINAKDVSFEEMDSEE